MGDRLRRLSVILTVLATIVINVLANALPINGLSTAQISDRHNVYFVPPGDVFAIWGLIYTGLAAFAIFRVLPSQRRNPHVRAACPLEAATWPTMDGARRLGATALRQISAGPCVGIADVFVPHGHPRRRREIKPEGGTACPRSR